MRVISIETAKKLTLAIGLVVFALAMLVGPLSDVISSVNAERISGWVGAAGAWGPILIIALMTVAIVASPIPSAPIALAAGAAYGHTLGTVYIIAGAGLGALIAFLLARFLGREMISRWLGNRVDAGWLGSQNALTAMVFASRLLPFVSFDIVSYAAGLSRLHFWRFAIATLAGIIPASFILAHVGREAVSGRAEQTVWIAIGLGAMTLTPLVIAGIRDWRKKRQSSSCTSQTH